MWAAPWTVRGDRACGRPQGLSGLLSMGGHGHKSWGRTWFHRGSGQQAPRTWSAAGVFSKRKGGGLRFQVSGGTRLLKGPAGLSLGELTRGHRVHQEGRREQRRGQRWTQGGPPMARVSGGLPVHSGAKAEDRC